MNSWPYLVSNLGRVARSDTKQLKAFAPQCYTPEFVRFRFVLLKDNFGARKREKRVMVGRLVAEAFLAPAPTLEHVVIYLDKNFNNNSASNLRWGTKEEAVEHHRGSHGKV